MKERVEVGDLKIGMFVAELDRPWLESPFLFQGFLIESEQERATLQAVCEYVFVDPERSSVREVRSAATAQAIPQRVPSRRYSMADAVRANDPRRFADSYRQAMKLQKRAHLALIRLIDERRLGKLVNAQPILEVIRDLTAAVVDNPNTALWLTKFREQDEFNATHSVNVAILSVAFGRHLGLPTETLHAIGLGAMLHDIGLTEPSNDIIRRKIKLDEKDFAIVRRHPVDGLFSLKRLNEMPPMTRDIIRSHHERIDGTGYPHGLKDDEIPQHARIVGIADVYDAMTSDRAYRPAMQPPDVLTELHRNASRTFGYKLVQSFIHCIGIYPVGSVVKLNTGAIAMVASTYPGVRLTPLVLLLKDSLGRHMNPRRMVNLAVASSGDGKSWSIEGVVNPSRHGINVTSIAVDEMRAFG